MVRLIFTEGDSWTSGDIIDPKLKAKGITDINNIENDKYRLPKVWPNKLAKKFKVQVKNTSRAGSSNDGILRRTINNILSLLEIYKPNEIFAIIGWSSPERKDFFHKSKSWDTYYPAQADSYSKEDKERYDFFKRYVSLYWQEEEYITRYINQTILIHNFLKSKKIKHVFFNAFYENNTGAFHKQPELKTFIEKYHRQGKKHPHYLEYIGLNKSIQEYIRIEKKYFTKYSFREFISNKKREKHYDGIHPNQLSHRLWSNYLHSHLKDKYNDQFN